MSTPGIPKNQIPYSNVRKSSASTGSGSGLRARAGGGLSSVQRTEVFTRALGTGVANRSSGGWVGAKRSFSPYDTQSALINRNAQMRAEANRYAGLNTGFEYATMGGVSGSDGMDPLTKIAIAAQVGGTLGNAVFGILNATGVIGNKTEVSNNSGTKKLKDLKLESGNVSTAKTLTGGLKGATSFSSIKDLETQANDKKANLNSSYKETSVKDAVDEKLSSENVRAGLKAAEVGDIDTSALALSDLNSDNLEASLKTIDTDINNITNLQTSTLPTAKNAVTGKLGEVSQAIVAKTSKLEQLKSQRGNENAPADLEAQISKLEQEIKELKDKKSQLEAASKAIDEVISQCGDAITALKGKKIEINDIKEFEDSVKDKKYDLAKTQDEQLKKTMGQIEKLNKEINSLKDKDPNKATKSDQNRLAKYNQLIQQRSGLYQTLGVLTESLSSAGQTEFKNSNGKSYTLKNLDKAISLGAEPQEQPLDIDKSSFNLSGDDVKNIGNSSLILMAANGKNATITDAAGQEYIVNVSLGNDGKGIYTINNEQKTMEEFVAFVADKQLV